MTVLNRARGLLVTHRQQTRNRQRTVLRRSAATIGLPYSRGHFLSYVQGKPKPSCRTDYSRSTATMS